MIEDFLGELNVAFGPFGARVVGENGLPEAGGLGKSYAAGDECFENLVSEEFPEVGGDLAGEVGPVIEHGEEYAFDAEVVLEGIADAVDGVHEFGDALEGEELALDGNEDGIGGDECVEGEKVEGRRAVYEDEPVLLADRGDALAEAELALRDIDEFEVGSDEVLVGTEEGQAVEGRRKDCCGDVGVADEDMVGAGPSVVFGDPESSGGISLGVRVDDQNREIGSGEGSAEVDGGGCFADAAFLIGNS
jgi:hypothetical protein